MKNEGLIYRLSWGLPSLLTAPFVLGLGLWSWDAVKYSLMALAIPLLLHWIRWAHPLVALSCWAVVWYEFVRTGLKEFDKHSGLDLYTGLFFLAVFGLLFLFLTVLSLGSALQVVTGKDPFGIEDAKTNQPPADKPELKESFDPYAVLGITATATPAEVKEAYRLQMAQYHPDKVEHLGAELQALAREKTLQIQRAIEVLEAA